MKVHYGLSGFTAPSYAIVTSGTFDGVHRGHQKILDRLKEIGQQSQGSTVVITFWPHPRIVLGKDTHELKMLSTIEEKIDQLSQQGIDHLVILPFTREFSQMSPDTFIETIYRQGVGTRKLVIGYDHRFGKNREGSFEYLVQRASGYPFSIEEIPREDIKDIGISSTKIREALQNGAVDLARTYLGRPYQLRGTVAHGDKLGRTIGFPTANIDVPEAYKLIPGHGIYTIHLKIAEEIFPGMLYIGERPTLENDTELRIEANLFDFDRDIYGAQVEVLFFEKIREDARFDSLEEMKAQLHQDGLLAREKLKTY